MLSQDDHSVPVLREQFDRLSRSYEDAFRDHVDSLPIESGDASEEQRSQRSAHHVAERHRQGRLAIATKAGGEEVLSRVWALLKFLVADSLRGDRRSRLLTRSDEEFRGTAESAGFVLSVAPPGASAEIEMSRRPPAIPNPRRTKNFKARSLTPYRRSMTCSQPTRATMECPPKNAGSREAPPVPEPQAPEFVFR